MASRPINGEEIDKLKPLFEIPSAATEHVVAMDGIAVVVNRANHVVKLSVSQIADIFSGTITSWSQVGGSSQPIQRYVRGTDSGTYDTFQHLVMHGKKSPPREPRSSRASLSRAVSEDGGIGFIGLPYVDHCKALAVQDGDGAALAPSAFSVATEDYALSRRLFFYTPEKPAKALASQFVDFALSDDGQEENRGADRLRLARGGGGESSEPGERAGGVHDGRRRSAERLSLDSRYHAGTSALDVKGKADVDRLVRYLKKATPEPTFRCSSFTDDTAWRQRT